MYYIKILHDEWYKDANLKIMGKCLSTIQQLTAYLGCLVEEHLMNGVEDISTTHYIDWYEDQYDPKMFMSRVHWTTIDPKIMKVDKAT